VIADIIWLVNTLIFFKVICDTVSADSNWKEKRAWEQLTELLRDLSQSHRFRHIHCTFDA
jgi:hypothetical protein